MNRPAITACLAWIVLGAPTLAVADPAPAERGPRISYGARLGLGMASIGGLSQEAVDAFAPGRTEADFDGGHTRTTFSGGVGMTVWLGLVNVSVEAAIARRGANFWYLDGRAIDGVGPLELYYVEVPVFARLQGRRHGKVRPFGFLGPQVAVLVDARLGCSSSCDSENAVEPQSTRSIDFAVVGGVGIVIPSRNLPDLVIDLRVGQGLVPLSSQTEEGRNRFGVLSIGFESS